METLSTSNLKIDDIEHVMTITGLPSIKQVEPVFMDRHGNPIHRFHMTIIHEGKEVVFQGPMHVFSELTFALYQKYLPKSYFEHMDGFMGMSIRMGLCNYRETDKEKKYFVDLVYNKAIEAKIQFVLRKTQKGTIGTKPLPLYTVQLKG